ncbi:MAG: aspartate-semialdehyde dehydrogenase [Anaerolineae bacterium]|nr:aspartate-semialdehyde dehydrogenase [Anaerolineae bacterium]
MIQPSSPIDVAILGATGAVGQRFIQLLENHPWLRVTTVVASDRSAGKSYREAANWVLTGMPSADVADLTVLPLDAKLDTPLVFSALPAEAATERELELAAAGHVVCSNVTSHRMTPDVPLLIPEVNGDHVELIDAQRRARGWTSGAIVTSPNCTTTPVVMALAPLRQFSITTMNAVSMQAISGGGYPGVASLDIFDNVIPYISGEEEKLVIETQKMLGTLASDHIVPLEATISAQCNRVPVFDGHLVAVSVALEAQPALDEVRAAWESFTGPEVVSELPSAPARPLIVHSAPDRPQPRRDRDLGDGMSASVGRLRECPVLGYKFIAMAHNTVRGAAGGAILNAELVIAQGYLGQ